MGDARDTDLFTIADLVDGTMERIRLGREGRLGLPTGFVDVDALTGGLHPRQFTLIGGRASMGETTLALNLCEQAIRVAGGSVLYAALGLTAADLAQRVLAMWSRIPLRKIVQGEEFRSGELDELDRAREELREAAFRVHAPAAATVPRIADEARALGRLDLIVVDTFQAIEPENPMGRRADQLERIGRQLKQLAREAEAPVVVLSELSRRVDRRPPHRPTMRDLGVPPAVHGEIDLLLLLHRPEYYDPNDQPGAADLIVARNTAGAHDEVMLTFNRHLPRFENFRSIPEGWF